MQRKEQQRQPSESPTPATMSPRAPSEAPYLGNQATLRLLGAAASQRASRARAVQRREGPGAPPERARSIEAIADAGARGPGGPLPHRPILDRAFHDHDLSGIRAYTGRTAAAASRSIGAEAYAIGDRVAFAERRPSLFTAAHEVAHVLQQRAGVQLKGGVGEAGDRYERNADAIAAAIVQGRATPPILGGDGSRGPRVQRRSELGEFIDDQREMMRRGRGELDGKHTTVGFEFEFATMDDGPFSGLSHVEIAKSSPMPDPAVPFVLETDASDALELVSPPFWVPTFGDQILPEPDHVANIIELFKERLTAITAKNPTVYRLARDLMVEDC
ncbi:MAG: DUF4157 domain-containing protein, partial [Nannocystaceae bacterium]